MTISHSIHANQRSLGILVDPEKLEVKDFPAFAKAMSLKTSWLIEKLGLDQIIYLVGGSTMDFVNLDEWMMAFKTLIPEKVILFPGSAHQITAHADGLLFLNLISGRNPEYLINQQVKGAGYLKNRELEVIPTAYLLIEGGRESAVQRVSQTLPMNPDNISSIIDTAYAGQLMGNQLIYLEAGSGAITPVSIELIRQVSSTLKVPIVVGGGLKTLAEIDDRFKAGAQVVVVGTAIEQDLNWKG